MNPGNELQMGRRYLNKQIFFALYSNKTKKQLPNVMALQVEKLMQKKHREKRSSLHGRTGRDPNQMTDNRSFTETEKELENKERKQ